MHLASAPSWEIEHQSLRLQIGQGCFAETRRQRLSRFRSGIIAAPCRALEWRPGAGAFIRASSPPGALVGLGSLARDECEDVLAAPAQACLGAVPQAQGLG